MCRGTVTVTYRSSEAWRTPVLLFGVLILRTWMHALNGSTPELYQKALAEEKGKFESCLHVHNLPDIFHYWSNRYVRPRLLSFGFETPEAMFARFLEERCREAGRGAKRFVSLGSGNCDLEIALAAGLRDRGHERFVIDCIDLNAAMLERGCTAAEQAGVFQHLEFTEADINAGAPFGPCDAVIGNQVLHHVLDLEGVLDNVRHSLKAGGTFIISDMIGRNGHRRWPEALDIVHEFWRGLPPSYRFNSLLRRYEELFEDWDCSSEGFEGVRSQDILPLLLRNFHFRLFVPFANIIDPFVDRAFGPHFDAEAEWDRAFIDEIQRRDEAEISAGALTPTHMLAVVGTDDRVSPIFPGKLAPESCVRGNGDHWHRDGSASSYHWHSWPHSPARELEIACERLTELTHRVEARAAQVKQLEAEFANRTAWALRLENQVEQRTVWARSLEKELEERTAWARSLEQELQQKTRDVEGLQQIIQQYLRRPHRFFARVIAGAYRRVSRLFPRT